MAQGDYIGRTDANVQDFCTNFVDVVKIAPQKYGVAPDILADLEGKLVDFVTKRQAAIHPNARGKRTIFLKDEARNSLVKLVRRVAQQINKATTTTNDQRQSLGITIPSTSRKQKPIPQVTPFLKVKSVDGRNVTVELFQANGRRARPANVAGATIFTTTPGATAAPRRGSEGWQFAENTTRTTVTLPFPPSSVGDTVWITACWTNSRGESGPAAKVLRVDLPAGGLLPAEMSEQAETSKLKAA